MMNITRIVTSLALLLSTMYGMASAAELTTLEGLKASGTLVQIDREFVTFQEAGQATPSRFPIKELETIDLKNKVVSPPADTAYDLIELTDGTRLRGTDLRIKNKTVEFTFLPGPASVAAPKQTLALSQLFWVLRRANNPAYVTEWATFLKSRGKRDLFVVRQSSGLNPLSGTVISGDETGERITFEREDGASSALPLIRANGGLVFNQIPRDVIPPMICRINDIFGNTWFATKIEIAGEGMTITTVSGATVQFPDSKGIALLDFSQGNIEYLAKLNPVVEYAPVEVDGPLGERFPFAPKLRKNRALNGGELILHGRKFTKGLSIPPDTTVTYPIEGYREFKTVLGMVDSVRPEESSLTVKILIDGREVLSETITKKDKPRDVTLNVKDAKELKIIVERNALFAGNQVNLAEARVQK